ncbi:Rrf2 family transcriptional regulator [Flammeovirgaceae bacterium SG7u.111]|nr:Rrf2 family transcriptional regulator [Flammeovirgaceae bacterium SG7u.132]WPO33566.1 Rrf2 family transcriptional regulator [Flammeovirgaceae bacterium SG7u.111]
MAGVFQMSEAASIAIHGMVLLVNAKEPLNAIQIAAKTGTSRHHVAKVLQRLSKSGLLDSFRGPKGGFVLSEGAKDVTFLELYEIIEGKITISKCPMEKQVCPFKLCIMEGITNRMNTEFKKYLSEQSLNKYIH